MKQTSQTLKVKFVDHLPKIRRIVSRIAKNQGVVDDITQEACVRIIEKEHLWNKQPNQFTQWMNTVTRNLTKNYLKKKKEKLLEGKEDHIPHPEVESFSEEQIKWVLVQFQALSQRQQDILYMKYYQGLTVTQIGKEIGLAQQTVSQHLNNALKTLRKKAKAQGFLAMLLPWNCLDKMMEVIIMGKKLKFVFVTLALCPMAYIGANLIGVDIFTGKNNENDRYSIIQTDRIDDAINEVERGNLKTIPKNLKPKVVASHVNSNTEIINKNRFETPIKKSEIITNKKFLEDHNVRIKEALSQCSFLLDLTKAEVEQKNTYRERVENTGLEFDVQATKQIEKMNETITNLKNELEDIDRLLSTYYIKEQVDVDFLTNDPNVKMEDIKSVNKHLIKKMNVLIDLAHTEERQKILHRELLRKSNFKFEDLKK